jgi:hypothetical protein
MTPIKQQVAIAEACGKKVCAHHPDMWVHRGTDGDSELYCTVCKEYLSDMRQPDYLNDRNAMRGAILSLPENLHSAYYCNLVEILRRNHGFIGGFHIATASPGEESEAFLRTISKWEDS